MTEFVLNDERLKGTVTEQAIDLLNSGSANFRVLSANRKSFAASKMVEVHQGNLSVLPNDARASKVFGYADPKTGLLHQFPDHVIAGTKRPANYIGNAVGNLVHEALHLDRNIYSLASGLLSSAEAAGVDISHPDIREIIEEKLIRDAVRTIDQVDDGWRGYKNYNKVDHIVDAYGRGLTPEQKDAITEFLNSDAYVAPTVVIDGKQYGLTPNGKPIEITPDQGILKSVQPVGFWEKLEEAVDSLVNSVGDAINAIGRAISDGFEALNNAVSSTLSAIGSFFSDVVDFFTEKNDQNENSSTDNDNGKPLILDMDGDGVEIDVTGDVSFDMDGDGFLENTHWVSPDDAFLVLDLNSDGTRGGGDGVIDQTAELVLTEWLDWDGATDLQALATFDQ